MSATEVTLKNGATVPEAAVKSIMVNLRGLEAAGVAGAVALAELAGLARDPGYDASYSMDMLVRYNLVKRGGNLHDIVRAVVLSAVTGEDFDIGLGSPYAE